MAIELPTKTIEQRPQRRTRLVEIDIKYGAAPTLRAHREIVNRDAAGKAIDKHNALEVNRSMGAVITERFTCADGTVIGPLHIAEALAGLIDKWETEDMASGVVAP